MSPWKSKLINLALGLCYILSAGAFFNFFLPPSGASLYLLLPTAALGLLFVRGVLSLVRESKLVYASSFDSVAKAILLVGTLMSIMLISLSLNIAAVLYNLEHYQSLKIFTGETTRLSIILFVFDQALAGLLFDLFEIFDLELPGSASSNFRSNIAVGIVFFLFRMLIGGALVASLVNIFSHNVRFSGESQHLQNVLILGKPMIIHVENILASAGGRTEIARQIMEQRMRTHSDDKPAERACDTGQ